MHHPGGVFSTGLTVLLALATAACKPAPSKQVSMVNGVEIVASPAVPRHKNPGRILKLREKLRIQEIGDEFFFKRPEHPEIGPDGSIFLMDEGQLLRFSPEGRFRGNLVKLGQGPGEIESLNCYLVEGDAVYAADGGTNKVVRMALDGRYVDDQRVEDYFETMTRDWIISSRVDLPTVRGVLADATYRFIGTSRSDRSLRRAYDFPGKFFIKPPIFLPWDSLAWIADAGRNLLFISLSRDYGIKVLDLSAGRIIRSFSRVYPRVPYDPPQNMKTVYARGGVPRPDFACDVVGLFLPDTSLWVRTSTVDERKGQLFDVFSVSGDFLDSFFVPVKDKILGIHGRTIFVEETAENGTIAVILYENLEYGR